MAAPRSKGELIDAIEKTYHKLREELSGIPADMTTQKDMDGHAKNTWMSVCNLVSYLVGWGELVLKWHEVRSTGEMPDLPETGFKMNELGRLAQKFYADYDGIPFQDLLRIYDATVNEILEVIRGMDNEELYEVDWYKKYPFGRMIQLNTSSPYSNARARIRKWKRKRDL